MLKNQKLIFIFILLLGILLRILFLGTVPSGFFRDESAIGYNAYSIWKTGMDEYGKTTPVVFRSFEGFFLPIYLYLLSPIVGIFGLTEFNTRILSSISGIIALVFVFLIGRKLFGIKTGLFAMFLLAISPWHVFYSRGAFEGNLALTLFTAGFYFWTVFLDKHQPKYFLISTTLFAVSLYTYQAERVVVLLFAIVALILSFQRIWKLKKKLILQVFILFLLLLPMFYISTKAAGIQRASNVSLFSSPPPGYDRSVPSGLVKNSYVYLRVRQIGALYFSYFSPRNLFFEGDYDRQRSVENMSVFYFFVFPLLVLGFIRIFRRLKIYDKLILSWVFISPIPASLTADPFHTYRSLMLYLPLTIISGVGASYMFRTINQKAIYLLLFLTFSLTGLSYFIFNYIAINNVSRARDWDYGYREMVNYVIGLEANKVIVDDMWTEPYIHFLFYSPENYWLYKGEVEQLKKPDNYYYETQGRLRPSKFGRYEFRKVDWPTERGDKGNIFVIYAKDLPVSAYDTDPNVRLLKEIKYPNGEIAYRIVQII